MFEAFKRKLVFWLSTLLVALVVSSVILLQIFLYYSRDLPDYHQLENYDPPGITRMYTADGHILEELATQNRIYTNYDEIPTIVINAFLAAEDKNFFSHKGVELLSIIRAAGHNILNIGKGRNPSGGSTITQQVVKNFLLTNERTFSRKIKEAILAYRITNVYSKRKILELYLNQIYLGNHSYGIASAALNYFNKELTELSVEESALLAGMPKAPSYLNPINNYDRALSRRNWVLQRMFEEEMITSEEYSRATKTPIILQKRYTTDFFRSEYYAKSVRQELIEIFGKEAVYRDGLKVYTALNERLQRFAEQALQQGLRNYDKKHGYRGPLGRIDKNSTDLLRKLKSFPKPLDIEPFEIALVTATESKTAKVILADGRSGVIPLDSMSWAKKSLPEQRVGPAITSVKDVLKVDDVILVRQSPNKQGEYYLEQIPDVNGALVVLENKTGRVLAQVGGYSYKKSSFNRATQAKRQPGSAFKPFVYLAAFERGWQPNSIIEDAPISVSQGKGMPTWTPKNYGNDFLGKITLRKALEKSKNLATVRLIVTLGIDSVIEISERLGIYKDPPRNYSMALGAAETTVTDLANAYNMIASGGMMLKSITIDRVYDRKGNLIYATDNLKVINDSLSSYPPPNLEYKYEQIIDRDVNYQLISVLKGAVERGTAVKAKSLKHQMAGKTGTTNNSFDAWFVGFTPDITTAVYVGFDNPRSLGPQAEGANTALPIYISFMEKALDTFSSVEFELPEGIKLTKIDSSTGIEADEYSDPKNIVIEAIRTQDNIKSDDEINWLFEKQNHTPTEQYKSQEAMEITS